MLTMFMYSHFYRVAVGDMRKQIELNSELVYKMILEQKMNWSALMSHVPDVDKTEYVSVKCKSGCCKYFLEKK